jgi:hypothetical protein
MPRRILTFEDDADAVPDEAILYRRIVWDKIGGRGKYPQGAAGHLNGNCFTDWSAEKADQEGLPGPCMSVGVSIVLDSLGYPAEKILDGYPECGLACITAGALRTLTKADGTPCPQGIMLAPTEKEPWHGVVFDPSGGQRGRAARNAIATVADWIVPLVNS